uniref:Cysteine-rich PDZ-binding protein n=1 Tax=Spodoptera frugiperda TaxID=7108 RepID=A0A2H1WU68_SPOFR
MMCEKCEKKLGRVITPDPWKSGARNTVESGGRKVGENKTLTAKKGRFNPYTSKFQECRQVFILLLLLNEFFIFSESAEPKSTKLDPTTARPAPTRRGYVLCAAKKYWTLRTIDRVLHRTLFS